MNRPPPELFTAERPVRSDFARERSYARRRIATLTILAVIIGGGVYAMWGHKPPDPADIPTIKAEGTYRQKPADPGGIDIPHQDVHVYDQLEGKGAAPAPVEHLLPPPENPMPAAQPAQVPSTPVAQQQTQADVNLIDPTPKPVATTVAPTVASAEVLQNTATPQTAPEPPKPTAKAKLPPGSIMSISQILASVKAGAAKKAQTDTTKPTNTTPQVAAQEPAAQPVVMQPVETAPQQIPAPAVVQSNTAPPPIATQPGNAVIQVASVPDEKKANETMAELQQKYASDLSGITLHLTRADLGAKGIYYRIQSQKISQDAATNICAALKQKGAGCILVRR